VVVYVAGASGFVGGATYRALLSKGLDVVGLTRQPTDNGYAAISYDQLTPQAGDQLVYLAESSDAAAANPADAVERLQRVLAGPWRAIVYASSGIIYGDGSVKPRRESDPTPAPGDYARAKLQCEALALAHPCGAALRLANVIGPGMSKKNVLSDILAQITGSDPIRVRNKEAIRDFVDVDDVAQAFCVAVEGLACGPFNVGSGIGISVQQLAEASMAAAGQSNRSVESTAPSIGKSELVLDVTLMHDRLGWRPTRSLGQTLSKLVRKER
jgi:UDP-glucose 4-epimerase